MGPQLVRCGMPPSIHAGVYTRQSFNGAATCSLRNAGSDLQPVRSQCVLQWGRNLFVAEWSAHMIIRGSGPHLQWGRNLFVAECNIMGMVAVFIGLAFNGAATCSLRNANPLPTSSNHPSSFNGAATCSLRNAAPITAKSSPAAALQWGRNLFVAECWTSA